MLSFLFLSFLYSLLSRILPPLPLISLSVSLLVSFFLLSDLPTLTSPSFFSLSAVLFFNLSAQYLFFLFFLSSVFPVILFSWRCPFASLFYLFIYRLLSFYFYPQVSASLFLKIPFFPSFLCHPFSVPSSLPPSTLLSFITFITFFFSLAVHPLVSIFFSYSLPSYGPVSAPVALVQEKMLAPPSLWLWVCTAGPFFLAWRLFLPLGNVERSQLAGAGITSLNFPVETPGKCHGRRWSLIRGDPFSKGNFLLYLRPGPEGPEWKIPNGKLPVVWSC